ncbi:MAG: DNA-binding protein [Peptostreptococcaceae bacterium]|nr:DNA-binding protein [Peptostreptococcaceae bacterium]
MEKIKRRSIKTACSLFLSLLLVLSGLLPQYKNVAYAAPNILKNIVIKQLSYDLVENGKGEKSIELSISGESFTQKLDDTDRNPVSVIKAIMVKSGTGQPISLTDANAKRAGVVVDVNSNHIRIIPPKSGPMNGLGLSTSGKNTVIIETIQDNENIYSFSFLIDSFPEMRRILPSNKIFSGMEIRLQGNNLQNVEEVNIAAASHLKDDIEFITIPPDKQEIKVKKQKPGNPNNKAVRLIKRGEATEKSNNITGKIIIETASRYEDKIEYYEPLENMNYLRVTPSEGPVGRSTKFIVEAMSDSSHAQVLNNVFTGKYELFFRDEKGKEIKVKQDTVKVIRETEGDSTSAIIGIEAFTPVPNNQILEGSVWSVVIKENGKEATAEKAYAFRKGDNTPQIIEVFPKEGPDTGGTNVLIVGKNIFQLNMIGLKKPQNLKLPSATLQPKIKGTESLVVTYENLSPEPDGSSNNVRYGVKEVDKIEREIQVRIESVTQPVNTKIYKLQTPPNNETSQEGLSYGNYHYTSTDDGIVVTTTNPSMTGSAQIVLSIENTIFYKDGKKDVFREGTVFDKAFNYIQTSLTPVVDSVTLEYGYPNDSEEESDEDRPYLNEDGTLASADGTEPLMLRIKGSNFEAYRDDRGRWHYPKVKLYMKRNPAPNPADNPPLEKVFQLLPIVSSRAMGDTKLLDGDGVPIDGIFTKEGEILVVSLTPQDKRALRELIKGAEVQLGGYKEIQSIVVVENPSGKQNIPDPNGPKFSLRRPTETSVTQKHSKQPKIVSLTYNGSPVKKLPSDAESEVELRVRSTAGISDLKKTKIAVDGIDISQRITETLRQGEDEIFKLKIPANFFGKSRLQLITPEGLMDSYSIIFDSIKGPEIKEIVPNIGDKGTIVVIKRDTQVNTVGFKVPIPNSSNEEERIGSKVLLNGLDISAAFGGYEKKNNKVVYQTVDDFKNFLQKEKNEPASTVSLPSKYVYVVDADTIYLKIPNNERIKEGEHKIQIRNPDGSESIKAHPFTIVDVVEKTKIGTIIPDKDDIRGGIITTITAGKDEKGKQTGFKGGVDVYFGSQKAEVIGHNPEFREVYVRVPPLVDFKFPESIENKVESYTVPVTLQNKVNKSTDTKSDGFVYLNPSYTVKITEVYNQKFSSEPKNSEANKGVEGDMLIIRGENFRLETDRKTGKFILPKVMFGYTVAEEALEFGAKNTKSDGTPDTDKNGRAELEWIKVKVPRKPINIKKNGSVSILVQNPDGAKDIKEDAFIYADNQPKINLEKSTLKASRFSDNIIIVANDIVEQGLTVAFGPDKEMRYEKEHSASKMDITTENQLEKIIVEYTPNSQGDDLAIYYKKGSTKVLMEDALNTNKGRLKLPPIGKKAVIGLNWKNPLYHTTGVVENKELLGKLNTEYVEIYIRNKTPNINTLVVRRGLGKVTGFHWDADVSEAKISIDTPYHEKAEETVITLINADESSAQAPFEFHGGLVKPIIKDVSGSIEDPDLKGRKPMVKIRTNPWNLEEEITITGEHFKDIERVQVGSKEVKVISVAPDYKSLTVKIPKGESSLIGVKQVIMITTKEGSASSDKPVKDYPIIYFVYTNAASEPVIDKVTPLKGPRTGGTYVRLEGKNFRETNEYGIKGEVKVRVNEKVAKIRSIDRNAAGEITALNIEMPVSVTGSASIRITNADNGFAIFDGFTYISQPEIHSLKITDKKVIIQGADFIKGALLYLGAKFQLGGEKPDNAKAEGILGVENGNNRPAYIIGGTEKALTFVSEEQVEAEFKDKEELRKFLKETNDLKIIIHNPDEGVSDPTQKMEELLRPNTPIIHAEPGAEGSVVLSWRVNPEALNAAEKFEVYAKLSSDSEYTFVGDTRQNTPEQAYIVKGLEHGTGYDFKVRVLNKYGEAKDLGYVRGFTLSASKDYKQQEKQAAADRAVDQIKASGKQEIVGTTLRYTAGTAQTAVDFTKNAKYKEKQLQIPVRDILTNRGKILFVTDGKINLQLSHAALSVPELSKASEDAFLRVSFSQPDKKKEDALRSAIGRKSMRLSPIYKLDFELVEPKKTLKIKQLAGTISIGFPAGEAGYPAEYMDRNDRFERLSGTTISKGGYYVLLKDKNK